MSDESVRTVAEQRADSQWMAALHPEKRAEIEREESDYARMRSILSGVAPELVDIATRLRPDWPASTFDTFSQELWSRLFDEAVARGVVQETTEPPAPRSARESRPIETAVYRAFNATGVLLYVGITNNPRTRMRGHERTSEWWAEMQSVSFEWFESRELAEARERELVESLRPPFNVVMNPEAMPGGRKL